MVAGRRRVAFWLVGLAVAALIWAFRGEPRMIVVREITIAAPVPAPLTIAFLSDFHVGSPPFGLAELAGVVDRVNARRPDVVVLGGDFVSGRDGGGVAIEDTAAQLARLDPPLGTYSVLGNHDWWFDGERVRRALESVGVSVVENSALRLDDGVWLAGLADDTTRKPDAHKALARVPPEAPFIALMHDPANLPDWPRRAVVALAGHTHGGQVSLPFIGPPIVPGRAPRRLAHGLMEEDGQTVYVTSGLGTSIMPVRFNMPPEMVYLTLVPGG